MKVWNALFIIIYCLAYINYSKGFEEKVCDGLVDIYKEQYYILKERFQGCTYIKGSLCLYKLQPGDDLSFLKSIRVIEGYLQIWLNGIPTIPLDNLQIIMGKELAPRNNPRYALYIADNAYEGRDNEATYERYQASHDPYLTNETAEARKIRLLGGAVPAYARNSAPETETVLASLLRSVQFYSLGEIPRGGVYIHRNPGLCNLMATVNWSDIVTGPANESPIHIASLNNHEPFQNESKQQQMCPPLSAACSPSCAGGNCWTYDRCQRVHSRDCYPYCPRINPFQSSLTEPSRNTFAPRCTGPLSRQCCDPECAGSCTGHTDRDCTVCRHFYDTVGRRCVDSCPFDRFGPPGPGRLFTYGTECVSRCPSHYLALDGLCLKTCPQGYVEGRDPNEPPDSPPTCLKFDCSAGHIDPSDPFGTTPRGLAYATHCPKSCPTVIDLYVQNIAQLRDCQIVSGELSILELAFSPRRSYVNDTHDVMLRPFVFAELDSLRSVRKITGNLRIQKLHPDIRSLEFFDNLREISGREKLMEDKFCLFVCNTHLDYFGTRSLASLPGGGLGFENNTHLCYNDKGLDWPISSDSSLIRPNAWMSVTRSRPDPDSPATQSIRRYVTGDGRTILVRYLRDRGEADCAASRSLCHEQCSTRSYVSTTDPALQRRCWGPGPHMCFGCAHDKLIISLRNHSLVHDVINAMGAVMELVQARNQTDLLRIMNDAVAQIFGRPDLDWDLDSVGLLIGSQGGARLLNFYGDHVTMCVANCQDLSSSSQWAEFYKSLLTVFEQIKPAEAPSITETGKLELDLMTFADIKLQIKDVFEKVLGPDLGFPGSNSIISPSRDHLVFGYRWQRQLPKDDPNEPIIDGDTLGHVCRLCHPECDVGCTGSTADLCSACKHFSLPIGGHDSNPSLQCVRTCPPSHYGHVTTRTCRPCHDNCASCSGPGENLGPGGCRTCKLLHEGASNRRSCLPPDQCPDGFYASTLERANLVRNVPFNLDGKSGAKVCLACESVCQSCNGPGISSCTVCKHYMFHGACLQNCPHKVYGISGLKPAQAEEISKAVAAKDRARVNAIFLGYGRCPCNTECGDNNCTGPGDIQCSATCRHLAIQMDGKSFVFKCVPHCPRGMEKIEVLDNGMKVCRPGDMKYETIVLLKSSAIPSVLIILICIVALYIGKRYKEKRYRKKALEFRQLLSSISKVSPCEEISMATDITSADITDAIDDIFVTSSSSSPDVIGGHQGLRTIDEGLLSLNGLLRHGFFADSYQGFWNYPAISKNFPVHIKRLNDRINLDESGVRSFEASLATVARLRSREMVGKRLKSRTMDSSTPVEAAHSDPTTSSGAAGTSSSFTSIEQMALTCLVPVYGLASTSSPHPNDPLMAHGLLGTLLKKWSKKSSEQQHHHQRDDLNTESLYYDSLSGTQRSLPYLIRPLTLVTQYPMAGCDLKRFFQRLRLDALRIDRQLLPAHQVMKQKVPQWCIQIADAMRFLAGHGIVHACLNTRCIQFYNLDQVKVDDYYYHDLLCEEDGNSTKSQFQNDFLQEHYKWIALECFLQSKFTTESDIWSFGVVLWELLSLGQDPYEDMDAPTCYDEILGGYRLPQPTFCDVMLYQIMIKCWLEHPEIRPSFEELYQTLSAFARHPERHFLSERMIQEHHWLVGNPLTNGLSSSKTSSATLQSKRSKPQNLPRRPLFSVPTNPEIEAPIGSGPLTATCGNRSGGTVTRSSTSSNAPEYYTEIIGGSGSSNYYPLYRDRSVDQANVYQYPDYRDIIRNAAVGNSKDYAGSVASSYLSPLVAHDTEGGAAMACYEKLIAQADTVPNCRTAYESSVARVLPRSDNIDGRHLRQIGTLSERDLFPDVPISKRNLKVYIPGNLSETII